MPFIWPAIVVPICCRRRQFCSWEAVGNPVRYLYLCSCRNRWLLNEKSFSKLLFLFVMLMWYQVSPLIPMCTQNSHLYHSHSPWSVAWVLRRIKYWAYRILGWYAVNSSVGVAWVRKERVSILETCFHRGWPQQLCRRLYPVSSPNCLALDNC